MLINRRNAMMAGKRLPYDAEVEYLESVGDQYIDTGYKFVFGDTIRATFAPTAAISSSTVYFFGADTAFDIGLSSHYDPTATASGVRAVYGSVAINNYILSPVVAYSPGTIYACEFTPSARKINDGLNTATVSNPGAANYTVTLFAARRNATIRPVSTGFAVTERFFSFSVERNGVKILDLIPVRKGTVGYMYDRVSGKLFGNDGTGDFVVGLDVVPVEWLETNGRQYIDTGVTCGSADTTVFEFDQSYSALQSGRFIWGSNYGANQGKDANNYYVCGLNRSDVVMQAGVVYHCKTQVAPDNAIKAYINGTLFRDNTGSSPYTNPFYIFRLGGYNGNDGEPSYLRIHHLTVSINNVRVRGFQPVRVGTEGAMMDVLTRRIYRRQGYGEFAYGNDLKYPIPAE